MKTAVLNLLAGCGMGLLAVAGAKTAAACDCAIFTSESLILLIDQLILMDDGEGDRTAEEYRWGDNVSFSKNIDGSFSVHVQDGALDTYLTLEEAGLEP